VTSNSDTARSNGHKVAKQKYHLRLFVTGQTPRSVKSVENLKRLCEKYLKGRYELEVIDIYQQPALASENQIIAAPTLIKKLPLPLRRLVGDFSNQDRVLLGLDLRLA
jgi:circadian clock protein KaiB